jgi:hypothetical protein
MKPIYSPRRHIESLRLGHEEIKRNLFFSFQRSDPIDLLEEHMPERADPSERHAAGRQDLPILTNRHFPEICPSLQKSTRASARGKKYIAVSNFR